jgi:hypothetical protein
MPCVSVAFPPFIILQLVQFSPIGWEPPPRPTNLYGLERLVLNVQPELM